VLSLPLSSLLQQLLSIGGVPVPPEWNIAVITVMCKKVTKPLCITAGQFRWHVAGKIMEWITVQQMTRY